MRNKQTTLHIDIAEGSLSPDIFHGCFLATLERAFSSRKPAVLNMITDVETVFYSMSPQVRGLPLFQ